jgi:hypothetical protein
MWRKITLGLLALTAVHAAAQEPASGRTIFRVGGGVGTSDYACAGCQIDAQTGFSGLLAAYRTIGGVLTTGVEATLSHTTGKQCRRDAGLRAGDAWRSRQVARAAVGHGRARVALVFGGWPQLERPGLLRARGCGSPGRTTPGREPFCGLSHDGWT